jgi:hypothetical protein
MILTVNQCRSSRLKNITVYLLLQSVFIVLRLRRERIQRGGHCGVGIRCKTNFKTLYMSVRLSPNDVIICLYPQFPFQASEQAGCGLSMTSTLTGSYLSSYHLSITVRKTR